MLCGEQIISRRNGGRQRGGGGAVAWTVRKLLQWTRCLLQGSGVQARMLVVEMKDVDRFGTCFEQRYVKIWKIVDDRFGGKIRITDSRNQSKSLQDLYLLNSLFIQHFQLYKSWYFIWTLIPFNVPQIFRKLFLWS